ncbi:hypothetical protein [Undibacterium sp. Ren11W]|uniref:hypothetical protein n=1 Tax=Undibacterium sp. Ren11W TaxID=3413045 RepID=UPI003BEFE949
MSIEEPNLENYGSPTYPLTPDPETNIRLSAILNEAAHVFDWHAEGLWRTAYKDGFARLLVPNIRLHPKLIRSILKLNDRVFSMVAYRAVELIKNNVDD